MFKLLVITSLEESIVPYLHNVLEYFADNNVHIDVIHGYEPQKDSAISIMNLNDLIYREKVKKMDAIVLQNKALTQHLINFQLHGKVRIGEIEDLVQNQLDANKYDAILFTYEIPKSVSRKLKQYQVPLFLPTSSRYTYHLSFEQNSEDTTSIGELTEVIRRLNMVEQEGGFLLNVPHI
ncbi:hypothetical protein SAMN05216474_2579 [Lishizhenia tianjinensis]|uniref:Uncharacterized protein n=1 Tax=Lishizhenia tianjinensis TaxID=477690 RepID=A0A1I7B8T1_9FLAO|nr:hypothetical protein [Lishizhenia tianjinensis]SFT83585.1 hypothetical protein SAMN05216474_2579 [Lishizhenia tianjinensis]